MGFINNKSGEWVRDMSALTKLEQRSKSDSYIPPTMPSTGGIINELAAVALFSAIAVDNYANKKEYAGALANAVTALLFVKYTARQVTVYYQSYMNP